MARSAFVDAMGTSLWVAVGVTLAATVVALVYLPRPTRSTDSALTEHGGHTAHRHPVAAGASSAPSHAIGAA
jgi:hypothetical protein